MKGCTVPKPDSFCSAIIDFQMMDSYSEVYWDIIKVLGSFGIVCNILSIAVFSHARMRSPINSLLWWLAVTDLLKIVGIVSEEWCDITVEKWESSLHCNVSYFSWNTFHAITVGLNTILAFCRYQAVANPLRSKSLCSYRNVRLSVLGVYIVGFALNVPTAMYLASEYFATVCHSNYMSSEMVYVIMTLISNVLPCIVLAVMSVKFVSAVMETRENPAIASTRKAAEKEERKAQLNNMIIVILILFLITEFPLVVMFVTYIFDIMNSNLDCNTTVDNVLASFIVINSSYNTLCYLKMSSRYRATLKSLMMWKKKRSSVTEYTLETQTS